MVVQLTLEEFTLLRDYIQSECGIQLQDGKQYFIENKLADLVVETGCDNFYSFYQKIRSNPDPRLKERIIDAITTNETLWFRDEHPYITLRDFIFPQWIEAIQAGRRNRYNIWSAACSTGQEPYSIAMMAHEAEAACNRPGVLTSRMTILATDISKSALHIAKNGVYNQLAMFRGMWPTISERYFEKKDNLWQVKPEITRMVTFRHFNLQSSFLEFEPQDLCFLRNVAIYFSHDFKVELYKKLARVLRDDGYLFLGATEMPHSYSQEFAMHQYQRCYYYQKGATPS